MFIYFFGLVNIMAWHETADIKLPMGSKCQTYSKFSQWSKNKMEVKEAYTE